MMLLLFCQCESLPLTGWFQSKSSSTELLQACQTVPFRGRHDTRLIHSAIGCSCSSHMYVLTDQVYFSPLMLCAHASMHTCMHARMHAYTRSYLLAKFLKGQFDRLQCSIRGGHLGFYLHHTPGKENLCNYISLSLYIYVIICRYAAVSFNVSSPLWCSV